MLSLRASLKTNIERFLISTNFCKTNALFAMLSSTSLLKIAHCVSLIIHRKIARVKDPVKSKYPPQLP